MTDQSYRGTTRPTRDEIEHMWNDALIVPDANVLCDVYRTSEDTREAILAALEHFGDRVRMPFQFAEEFFRNREEILLAQLNAYSQAISAVSELIRVAENRTKHPFLPQEQMVHLRGVLQALEDQKATIRSSFHDDKLRDRIDAILKGRVSPRTDEERLEQMYSEARARAASKQPPGFSDRRKPEPHCWGDYVGWKQLLEIAREAERSVIFVTGDVKADWWLRDEAKQTVGPRLELVAEFESLVIGRRFHMYKTFRFLEHVAQRGNGSVPPSAAKELQDLHRDSSAAKTRAHNSDLAADEPAKESLLQDVELRSSPPKMRTKYSRALPNYGRKWKTRTKGK